MSPSIALIIPCYNEASRLDIAAFRAFEGQFLFLFVNDGSTDATQTVLQRHFHSRSLILDCPLNGGKAEAIRQGMLYLMSRPEWANIDWVGFWDADLATPLGEVEHLLRSVSALHPDAVFAGRHPGPGTEIQRSWIRRTISFSLMFSFKLFFRISIRDTQCGAKLFRPHTILPLFSNHFHARWLFDIELLLRGKHFKIVEVPLRIWISKGKSTLNNPAQWPNILLDWVNIFRFYGFNQTSSKP